MPGRLRPKGRNGSASPWRPASSAARTRCRKWRFPFPLRNGCAEEFPEGLNIIASLAPGVRPVREVLEAARSRSVRHASLLVGPEGDFTDRETAMALEAGFVPVTLGPIVLRVETAAFFRPGRHAVRPGLSFFIRIPMFKNIIFDWSGTLVDDLALTLDASNYVFSQYGKPCMNRDEFRAEFPASLSGLLCPGAAPRGSG